MVENITLIQAFKLKGRFYTLTVLQLLNTDLAIFSQQLEEAITKAPKLFENTPVVFDLSAVHFFEFDLDALLQIARAKKIIPIGIQGGSSLHNTLASRQGIAVLHSSTTQDKEIEQFPEPLQTTTTKILTAQVRSGQQVVAKGSDLIITSSVSHGAELLSDGCIHVYGALRGRALAGLSGDKESRIFCQSLEAELISIAGFYCLSDAMEKHHGPCQIYLLDDHIQIDPL